MTGLELYLSDRKQSVVFEGYKSNTNEMILCHVDNYLKKSKQFSMYS